MSVSQNIAERIAHSVETPCLGACNFVDTNPRRNAVFNGHSDGGRREGGIFAQNTEQAQPPFKP